MLETFQDYYDDEPLLNDALHVEENYPTKDIYIVVRARRAST